MKHLGLFEGIGGFSLAARWMGWETVAWCEWMEWNQKLLRARFPEAEGFGDIRTTDFKKYANRIDVITGGFPCQPYSTAGKRQGKGDDRHLWPEMLRAIREVKPRWVVGENVHGLVNWSDGLVFEEVQADLEAEGYKVQPVILPAVGRGADHRRRRIWFIAYCDLYGCEERTQLEKGQQYDGRGDSWGESKSYGCTRFNTDSNINGLQGNITEPQTRRNANGFPQITGWENYTLESPICRVSDGIPDRVDRIKGLGNAIVPQVAFQIFKAIEQYEQLTLL